MDTKGNMYIFNFMAGKFLRNLLKLINKNFKLKMTRGSFLGGPLETVRSHKAIAKS